MGLFDEVALRCPHCGHRNLEQTKDGDCTLMTWDLAEAPPAVQAEVAGSHYCEECERGYTVHVQTLATICPY